MVAIRLVRRVAPDKSNLRAVGYLRPLVLETETERAHLRGAKVRGGSLTLNLNLILWDWNASERASARLSFFEVAETSSWDLCARLRREIFAPIRIQMCACE